MLPFQVKVLGLLKPVRTVLCKPQRSRLTGGPQLRGRGLAGRSSARSDKAAELPDPSAVGLTGLLKPTVFTACFCTVIFPAAAIWKYENMRRQALDRHRRFLGQWGEERQLIAGEWRRELHKSWKRLQKWWRANVTEEQQFFWSVCAINCAVYAMWRLPALRPMMTKYFSCDPYSRNVCWPMLLSGFSHFNFLHLCVNMYVLHSFSTPMVRAFGKEELCAFYLSSLVAAGLASHVYKVVTCTAGASLGASGGILALCALFASIHPDAQMQIVFLPVVQFSAAAALKGIIAFDLVGLVARWKFLDHSAHLGGTLFGMAYFYAYKALWSKMKTLVQLWHDNVRKGQ